MDKSTPQWIMVQDRNFRGRRKLEPIKTCSTAVDHHQLVHALKSTSNLPGSRYKINVTELN